MKTVVLRNGAEEAEPLVRVVLFSLRSLCTDAPLTFYDLVMLCRDSSYRAFAKMGPAEDAGLVQNGKIHDSVRNVILSAVTGDGLEMSIGSPVAKQADSGGDSVTVEDANRRLRASRERSGLDPDTGRRKTKSEDRRGGLPGKIDVTPAPEHCPPAKDYTKEDQ